LQREQLSTTSALKFPLLALTDFPASPIPTAHMAILVDSKTRILVQGITGLTADEVLAIPDDFPQSIGLTRAVSPLRIMGMTGMLARAKRQVALKRSL
jgi:hypothetical protein